MVKKKIKKENGFAATDAIIAVLIIALFVGLMTTIVYNIYIYNASIKRMKIATGYITNIFEYIDKSYYDDIDIQKLGNYIELENKEFFNIEDNKINVSSNNTSEEAKTIGNAEEAPYTIEIYLEYYNKTEGNEDKLDLVKQLTVTVNYKLGNRDQTITMKRVKSRENLVTPNIPDFTLLNIGEGENIYPIKREVDNWKVCDKKDSGWYNYEKGYWATVIISTQEPQTDDINTLILEDNVYVWIPRFSYNSAENSILFLYSNTNSYINSNTEPYSTIIELEDISGISDKFKNNTGLWVKANDDIDEYTILDKIYKRQV